MNEAVYVYRRKDSRTLEGPSDVTYELFSADGVSRISFTGSLTRLAMSVAGKANLLAERQGLVLYRNLVSPASARFEYDGVESTAVVGATSDSDELLTLQERFCEHMVLLDKTKQRRKSTRESVL